MASPLKNKQIVVSGHDPVHGGATLITWLLAQGASVTVAGMRDTVESAHLQRRVDEQLQRSAPDGRSYDHAVSRLSWTKRRRADVANVYELFLSGWRKKAVGVTGAVGKTTTALWAAHLIGDAVVAGHSPDKPLMSAMSSRARVAVLELDSVFMVAMPRLAVFSTERAAEYDASGSIRHALHAARFNARWGAHNVANAITAAHIARSLGATSASIAKRLASLPSIPYRQEVVHQDAKLTVINDATAATPEAGIAAMRRWGGPTCILITGGTGVEPDYRAWARELPSHIRQTNTIFLSGSATQKMRSALRRVGYSAPAYHSLSQAWHAALARAHTYVSGTIVFSPAVAGDSMERGRLLNECVATGTRIR